MQVINTRTLPSLTTKILMMMATPVFLNTIVELVGPSDDSPFCLENFDDDSGIAVAAAVPVTVTVTGAHEREHASATTLRSKGSILLHRMLGEVAPALQRIVFELDTTVVFESDEGGVRSVLVSEW